MNQSLELLQQAALLLGQRRYQDGPLELDFGGVMLLRSDRVTAIEDFIYEPLLCAILAGEKEVHTGNFSVRCPAGHAIIVSHDLAVRSQITIASFKAPYVALILPLDLAMLRNLLEAFPPTVATDSPMHAMAAFPIDSGLLDALSRLLLLGEDGKAASVLAPIIMREIHARLLLSQHGGILGRLVAHDEMPRQVTRAIASIRGSLHQPISVMELASAAGMSKSSFHTHFKTVTGLSPGQYQKNMRLLEARRLVKEGDITISSIAHRVGYESPAQFSRDYSRKFGAPPSDDRRGADALIPGRAQNGF